MKKLFAVIVFITLATTLIAAKSPSLEYTFQKRDSTSLLITVSFTGDNSGTTLLHLPNEWAGQIELYKTISRITALSAGTAVSPGDKPYEYLIKHPAGSKVSLSYVLSKDWTGPFVSPKYFRPVITKEYFFFEGSSGLAYPDIADSVQLKCTIAYIGFSGSDFVGNSFFANKAKQTFTTTINNLTNSFFCAGNFRTKTVEVNGHKIVMAITGKFLFTDDESFNAISDIILAERKFWNDEGSPYFFTLSLAMDDQFASGGTAHHNSFFLVQSSNIPLIQGPLPTIAHEYFHNWNGLGLLMPEPNEIYKWFSEGFTDYYSFKLLSKIGSLTPVEFATKMNVNIREYYLSPYFNSDNRLLIGRYWENGDLKRLSYRRGLTIAFMLDNKILEKGTASLDDLMRELYNQSKPKLIFSKELFDNLVVKYAGKQVLAAVDSANSGNNKALTQNLLDNKAYKTGALTVSKVFDYGFDFEASKAAKKITGLKPGSNAEKAGLLEGMEITNNFSIWINNTEKPMKVQIVRNGKREWITYIPATDANIMVPQIVTQ